MRQRVPRDRQPEYACRMSKRKVTNGSFDAQGFLESAGLADRADDEVAGFSRGMPQRLALERALLHRPRLVLLDEPFTGLDDRSVSAVSDRLRRLAADGAIVIVATHDLVEASLKRLHIQWASQREGPVYIVHRVARHQLL